MRRSFPLLVLALAACGPHKPAPVYDYKLAGTSAGTAIAANGDTLERIATRYALTIEDIIRTNQLPGQGLRAGQRIALPPPRHYTVRDGDTVVSIAGMFDVQPQAIVDINHLVAPYALQPGQVVQLPGAEHVRIAQQPENDSDMPPALPMDRVEAVPLDSVTKTDMSRMGMPRAPGDTQIPRSGGGNGMFTRPAEGPVISGYGPKPDGLFNDGINISAPAGSAVRAADAGTVVYTGKGLDGYGNLVLIRHDNGFFTVYSHMADIRVAKGAQVLRGQGIGSVGTTGRVLEPQLHFELRQGTKSLNPLEYL